MNRFKPINFDTVADLYDSCVNVDTDIPFFLKETENYKGDILELPEKGLLPDISIMNCMMIRVC